MIIKEEILNLFKFTKALTIFLTEGLCNKDIVPLVEQISKLPYRKISNIILSGQSSESISYRIFNRGRVRGELLVGKDYKIYGLSFRLDNRAVLYSISEDSEGFVESLNLNTD